MMGSAREEVGYLSEIFCSIQGEGHYAGTRQVFVRTAGCKAGCSYCDTAYSLVRTRTCRVQGPNSRELENPIEASKTREAVLEVVGEERCVRAVSITGGEPLEQGAFVAAVARLLKNDGFSVHLDTNGLETERLDQVLPHIDVVAMDVKLPSAIGCERWEKEEEFLRKARCCELFVKVVVSLASPDEEVERAVGMVAAIDRSIPVFLQPEAVDLAAVESRRGDLAVKLFRLQSRALEKLENVRVVPQLHKVLGVR